MRYKLYLKDIERAIENIEDSVRGLSLSDFSKSPDKIDSNAMRIQIIGESLKNISNNVWKESNLDRQSLIDFRNIISHAYFKINPALLWDIIKKKIPALKEEVKKILGELK